MKNEYIYGRQPVIEALEAHQKIEKVFIQKGTHGEGIGQILKRSKEQNIPTSYVPSHKLKKYTQHNHQGVVALLSHITYIPLQDIIDQVFSTGKSPFLVVIEGISDTRNIGAIARSAYALGADAIVLNMKNTAPVNADVIKTSAGAALKIHWCKERNMDQVLNTLELNGIQTFASDLQATQTLDQQDLTMPLAVVLGAEDTGISPQVRSKATHTYLLPMCRDFDSLNVSVAAGISFYLISEKRRTNENNRMP